MADIQRFKDDKTGRFAVENYRKSSVIGLRVTNYELTTVTELAQKEGVSVSEFIRRLMNDAIAKGAF